MSVRSALSALCIVERNALVYRRTWRGTVFSNFLQPTLFLLALGMGLGPLVDSGPARLPGGVDFMHFLAPGLLAGAAMQSASFESSYAILGKMTWHRNYDAIIATPVGVVALVLGELAWMAVRQLMIAGAFTVVLVAFGIPRSPLVILAIPAAVLTGLAFSAPIMAHAATLKRSGNFNMMFRFGITPLFLFSGIFVPVTSMPSWLETAAWFTPLFHGVELVRGLTLGTLSSPAWLGHTAYLTAMLILGTLASCRTFRRRLSA
jgi:lipooligosaccharide transport system permease protein